jgi:hypothetical protein
MAGLQEIEQRTLDAATAATDLETTLKALEANRAVREMLAKEREGKWFGRFERFATLTAPSTAVFAIFLSIGTLIFQMVQFYWTSKAQTDTAETSAWREALKNMSMRDDSLVLSSTVQMESFFRSPRYSQDSRSIASVLLPCVTIGAAFDEAAGAMERSSNKTNQVDLFAVAHGIEDEEWTLYSRSEAAKKGITFAEFIENPTDAIKEGQTFKRSSSKGNLQAKSADSSEISSSSECEADGQSNPLKRALVDSYDEDTISRQIARFWKDHKDATPGPAQIDISGLVLDNVDLSGIDFSNSSLAHTMISYSNVHAAKFKNVKLDQAVFVHLTGFADSTWDGSNWWTANALDCNLAQYLQSKFQAPSEAASEAATLLQKSCAKHK